MRRITTLVALLATTRGVSLHAQGPQGQPGLLPDPFGRFLFPPELVMQHQERSISRTRNARRSRRQSSRRSPSSSISNGG